MHDEERFQLMKKELFKAAATIQKLKQQRDKYKVSYELIKNEGLSIRDSNKKNKFLGDLQENNQNLQTELIKSKKLVLEKDRIIAKLQNQIQKANNEHNLSLKSLQEIENARKELKNELNSLSSSPEDGYPKMRKTVSTLLSKLQRNPSIYKIFKSEVQCTKRFRALADQENYTVCFQYLANFIIELIDSFQFCEDSDQSIEYRDEFNLQFKNTDDDSSRHKSSTDKDYNSRADTTYEIKASLEKQSIRLGKLSAEMDKISKGSKKLDQRADENVIVHKKSYKVHTHAKQIDRKDSDDSCEDIKISNKSYKGYARPSANQTDQKYSEHKREDIKPWPRNQFGFKRIESNLRKNSVQTGLNHELSSEFLKDTSLVSFRNKSINKSRSPRNTKVGEDKYMEYSSPILRKADGWPSVAEYFSGEKNHGIA
jgi:hypothetical protein